MTKYLILSMLTLIATSLSAQGVSFSNSDNITVLENKISSLDDDHCEVPCGIYGDSLRVALIREHVSTVEKAMKQINELSDAAKPNYNQLVRWINNKEKHAEEIQHIVSQYFLHQRVKMPKKDLSKKALKKAKAKYNGQLSSLHQILVYAMKTKQTTDLSHIENINAAIESFEDWYFHGHEH